MPDQPPEDRPAGSQSDPSTDDVADLLGLLADAREDAEGLRRRLASAEARADRAVAEADMLKDEIDGMTSTVVDLDRRLDAATAQLTVRQNELATLAGELDEARTAATQASADLDQPRSRASGKVTGPLRSIVGGKAGRRRSDR